MKAEQYIVTSDQVKKNLINRIYDIPIDGKTKVSISASGSKSAKQRGLQWKWFTEVSEAGIGGKHEDSKEGVSLISKWRWGIPILMRDDAFFADLFAIYRNKWGEDEDRMRYFVNVYVHTEQFNTSQMAEFLTEFQRHYGPLVNLTDPQEGMLQ